MDTDDLSQETYDAIIITAEKFHHDLTLQFGILASDCKTDDIFLDVCESLIKEWLTEWDLEEAMLDIFYDDLPNIKDFKKTLDKYCQRLKVLEKFQLKNVSLKFVEEIKKNSFDRNKTNHENIN
ncbi:MAG: hypothetical protein WCL51_16370 [Bacteroidota bacterium]